ncbi:PREDICTED: endonuclease 4-like isoform X2 [Nicotiana attenuata]|uniref:endonuclease 4-like isoform X2 n=1 Tax=Nicotiana attenuata TaxID=49451 RepID=UPI000904EBDB|nr:PREDICTED: endonuclease 4-like isoform X2 [Nicotiana attenuata]
MGGFELIWFVRVTVILMMVPKILGWGKEGHYVICKIAESKSYSQIKLKVILQLSAPGLMRLSTTTRTTAGVLHYIMLIHLISCAITNIAETAMTGMDTRTDNLTEALMFLSHFVGDVHQPLHVGFTGDVGGNTIVVRWYRRKTNLHHVWDTMIIESALKTYYKSDLTLMIQALLRNITDEWSDDVPSWENCKKMVCPDPYASESVRLACKFAYRNATPGSTLGDDYFLSRLPVVEKRLAQSGIRLAEVLNRIFSKQPLAAQ